ncbi:MAG TPA: MFS transporter [Acidobacteriaceae bacterium]|nr:MFS transporter [Acidobacteriaceae bacterium]
MPASASAANQEPATRKPAARRWRIAWLLGLGVLVNYFDRVNLSVSQAALARDFAVSAVTFGWLASAYNWTYCLCQLPIGVILDKFGVRRVGLVSTFLWSVASFAAALAPNVGSLFAARFLLGVGEAPTFPANAKAVGRWFPERERSFATGIFDGMAKFASALGVPLLGLLLLKMGWRWSFAATGVVSLIYFWLFRRIYCEPHEDEKLTDAERAVIGHGAAGTGSHSLEHGAFTPEDEPVSLWKLMQQRKVIAMVLGFGSYNYIFYLFVTWLPGYLAIQLKMDLLHSFLYTGFPWLVATFGDLFVGGWLADWLMQRGWDANRVRKTILIGGTACGLGILGAARPTGPVAALCWLSLSIGGLSAAAPIGWSVPGLVAPRSSVGSMGGIMNFSNQVSGILAAVLTGYFVQSLHSFTLAFSVAAAYLCVGICAYIFLLGRIEPMDLSVDGGR